ncbi:MAG TPA: ROK family protein [Phycisphaerae bacterium]|nr:ROK family protein [Phycisphaerae bacterium]
MPARTRRSGSPRSRAVGIDIGGTSVRAALVDNSAHILAATRAPTPPGGNPEQLAETLARLVVEIPGQAAATIPTIGVALPGIRDAETDVMQRAVNLPRLEGVNVRELLEHALHRPVYLETDVNAAGWAQWRASTPLPRRFAYLSLGTGVGGCVILDGEIVRHTHDGAGHFGHLVVDTARDAAPCGCGGRGCLEAITSRPPSAEAAARDEWTTKAANALALGLLQIAHLYAPDTIMLGGGVLEHHPELVPRTQSAFDALRSTLVPEQMTIQAAPLPADEAGVIGVALLALATSVRA